MCYNMIKKKCIFIDYSGSGGQTIKIKSTQTFKYNSSLYSSSHISISKKNQSDQVESLMLHPSLSFKEMPCGEY